MSFAAEKSPDLRPAGTSRTGGSQVVTLHNTRGGVRGPGVEAMKSFRVALPLIVIIVGLLAMAVATRSL
jgi:hypothetical protein